MLHMIKEEFQHMSEDEKRHWFCESWAQIKTPLQLAMTLFKNPFVRIAAAVLIAAGNTLHNEICGEGKKGKKLFGIFSRKNKNEN